MFDMEKRNYISEVRESISPIIATKELTELQVSMQHSVEKLIHHKVNQKVPIKEFQPLLRAKIDSFRMKGNKWLEADKQKNSILKEHDLRFQLTKINFELNEKSYTILSEKDQPLIYFGHQISDENSFIVHHGSSINKTSNSSELDSMKTYNSIHGITMNYKIDVDISNWQQMVLFRMKWILTAAIGLLLAVILLFFIMIRSLIRQKKNLEIKTDFVNNITHELKTPLTAIDLIIKSFQKSEIADNPVKRDEMFQTLERQNHRIQRIVDQVMETSLNHSFEKQRINISFYLKQIVDDFISQTHRLKAQIEDREIILKTNPIQLERVLQNLLENAQKYSPKGSEILLKSYLSNDKYCIEIIDQGIGIPEKEHLKIFDKFYRISEGNQHNVKGLGLGLFLSKQIIRDLGGEIVVKSKIKQGSKFTIELPL